MKLRVFPPPPNEEKSTPVPIHRGVHECLEVAFFPDRDSGPLGVWRGGEACAQSQLEEAKTHKDTLGPLWGRVEAHFISLVLWEQKKKKQNP